MQALVDAVDRPAAVVVVRNGRVVEVELGESAAKGVVVSAAGDGHAGVVGAALAEPPDVFATLNDAFVADPVVVDVPAGVVVPGPVVVVHLTEGEGVAAFPRLVVRAGDDSEVSVLEIQASGAGNALVVPVTEILVGRAARVGHVTVQGWAWRPGSSACRSRRWGPRRRSAPRASASAATTPGCGPTAACWAGRDRRARRRLLRRGHPDAGLPHVPGPRCPGLHVQPAVQGRRWASVAVGVHRDDPVGKQAWAPTPSRPTAT